MNSKDYTPEQAQAELLELVVKAARRCAYDLAHAAGDVRDPEWRKVFEARAQHWLTIFDPAKGPKDYRHRLHQEIRNLESEVERLSTLCREHGIKPENPRGLPF